MQNHESHAESGCPVRRSDVTLPPAPLVLQQVCSSAGVDTQDELSGSTLDGDAHQKIDRAPYSKTQVWVGGQLELGGLSCKARQAETARGR